MIIFMGVAGAGKSVQGTLLAEKLGYKWLSTGEYLRANVSGELKEQMLAGKLLSDEQIIDILKGFFESIGQDNGVILDGFPRTLAQAKWLYELHQNHKINIRDVIYLDASLKVVTERLLDRGRPDDTADVLGKRFEEYEKLTYPVVDWLKKQGLTVHTVNAEADVDEVQAEILNRLSIDTDV